MKIGNNLRELRNKNNLSQEDVAERLGVSRQTVSKWELDESIPDIYQSKRLAAIYKVSLDKLISFDVEMAKIEETIANSNVERDSKVDWTKAWSAKYPVLAEYENTVDTKQYAITLRKLLNQLKDDYDYDDLNAMLVLKDILSKNWK